jgi:uncharacterized protein YcbX
MSTSSSVTAAFGLEDVIDGIMDASTITDAQKESLLTRVQTEGGIVSAQLREDIATLFDAEAADAQTSVREDDALIQSLRTKMGAQDAEGTVEDAKTVIETAAAQNQVLAEFEKLLLNMRSDTERLERDASKAHEQAKEAPNMQEIEEIRRKLSGGK